MLDEMISKFLGLFFLMLFVLAFRAGPFIRDVWASYKRAAEAAEADAKGTDVSTDNEPE